MKKLCLLGPADKRVLAYPLIKTLTTLGKTLIVADDGAYRRFSEDFSTQYAWGNSFFFVTPEFTPSVQAEVDQLAGEYEYLLYILTKELPSSCDSVVYCRGANRAVLEEEALEVLENIDFTEVYVTFSKLQDNSALKLEPNKAILSYLYACEDQKDFLSLRDVAIAPVLFKFFGTLIDLPKSTIKDLLSRKG